MFILVKRMKRSKRDKGCFTEGDRSLSKAKSVLILKEVSKSCALLWVVSLVLRHPSGVCSVVPCLSPCCRWLWHQSCHPEDPCFCLRLTACFVTCGGSALPRSRPVVFLGFICDSETSGSFIRNSVCLAVVSALFGVLKQQLLNLSTECSQTNNKQWDLLCQVLFLFSLRVGF